MGLERFPNRYQRNFRALSREDQGKIAAATVAVVGCGGLGGYIAEEMARLGVGHLILIDGDKLDETNLNRQLFATEQALGQDKVEAARTRLESVNSATRLGTYTEWFNEENADKLFQGVDLVCDALDSISARKALERSCHFLNLPLVFASIGGWYGLLGVSLPGDYSISRLYGNGEEDRGVERIWGNPAFTPAVVASLAVAEGIKILTGKPVSLRKAWLQIDLLEMEFERFELATKESETLISSGY